MAKFRKKPVVIEAFQMTRERRWDNSEWPEWLNAAWQKDSSDKGAVFPMNAASDPNQIGIYTEEGQMTVGWDDWIIQGVKGELYACKPDIFEATYEAEPETDTEACTHSRTTFEPDFIERCISCGHERSNAAVNGHDDGRVYGKWILHSDGRVTMDDLSFDEAVKCFPFLTEQFPTEDAVREHFKKHTAQ